MAHACNINGVHLIWQSLQKSPNRQNKDTVNYHAYMVCTGYVLLIHYHYHECTEQYCDDISMVYIHNNAIHLYVYLFSYTNTQISREYTANDFFCINSCIL